MAEAYARLIMAGWKTIEQVPEKLRDKVQAILDTHGWEPPQPKLEEQMQEQAEETTAEETAEE